jgi:phage shock protein A
MSERRPRGLVGRIRSLLRGLASVWIRDRESRNPRAVYEQAIAERTEQYAELKQAVAGILYMRNKLTGEIEERRSELARTHDDIRRAVQKGEDEVALTLISHRHALLEDLERTEKELEQIREEVDTAKTNLVRFRNEIRTLEREKLHMLARLANARARRKVQEAFEGLSLDGEMRALEQVREHIARLDTEGRLDQELGDSGLESRIRAARGEARREVARSELDELKRHLRPVALPVREPQAAAASGS